MKQKVEDLISEKITCETAKRYADFCDWIKNKSEYDSSVESSVFTNIAFKKELAKKIVRSFLENGDYNSDFLELDGTLDRRLRSLVNYYWAVETNGHRHHKSCPVSLYDQEYAIVRMQPGDRFFKGYRCFVVNMLCFSSDKFILGFRTDFGPVNTPMKYYKGCRPLGIKKAKDGLEWNLILFDSALSDDYTAVFSNTLDGDGSIEMCDWLSDSNQRIIFRCGY